MEDNSDLGLIIIGLFAVICAYGKGLLDGQKDEREKKSYRDDDDSTDMS